MVLTDWMIKTLIGVGGFLGGSLLTLSVAYVTQGRDLAYIKGQLTSLLKFHSKLSKLYETMVVMEKDVVKLHSDLNQAHGKIRDLQKVSNQ